MDTTALRDYDYDDEIVGRVSHLIIGILQEIFNLVDVDAFDFLYYLEVGVDEWQGGEHFDFQLLN